MVPVHEWPFPFEVSDLHETYRTSLFPWEVTGAFPVCAGEGGASHVYAMPLRELIMPNDVCTPPPSVRRFHLPRDCFFISAPPTPQFALSAEAFKVAKTELGIHDYLMLASTTVLESLWAAFYATGEKRYVRRITELAQQWAAFSDDIPDHTDFWVNLEKKLPEALTVRPGLR